MIPIQINVFERDDYGGPGTTFVVPVSSRILNYSHSILAKGGFENCSFSFRCSYETALEWLDYGLQRHIIVYDRHGAIAWEGYISGVDASFGQEKRSISLKDFANRVYARYTNVLGTQASISAINNTDSQLLYGIKSTVLSLPELGSSAEATSYATQRLNDIAFPKAQPSSTIATGELGEVSVTITASGWYNVLAWLTTSYTPTSTAVTTDQLERLLIEYAGFNDFFSISNDNIDSSFVSVTQLIAQDTSYKDIIEKLLGFGNSSNQRQSWGIYEDREFHVTQWAGAFPETATYQRYLQNGKIYDAGGNEINPINIRPDAMYYVIDLLNTNVVDSTASDAAARFYIERVSYTANESGYSITLEPENSSSFDALLSRIT